MLNIKLASFLILTVIYLSLLNAQEPDIANSNGIVNSTIHGIIDTLPSEKNETIPIEQMNTIEDLPETTTMFGNIRPPLIKLDYKFQTADYKVVRDATNRNVNNPGIGYHVFSKSEILRLFDSTTTLTPPEGQPAGISFGRDTSDSLYAFCYVKSGSLGTIGTLFGIVRVRSDDYTIPNPQMNVGFLNYKTLPCPPYCSTWSYKETMIEKLIDSISELDNIKIENGSLNSKEKALRKALIKALEKYQQD